MGHAPSNFLLYLKQAVTGKHRISMTTSSKGPGTYANRSSQRPCEPQLAGRDPRFKNHLRANKNTFQQNPSGICFLMFHSFEFHCFFLSFFSEQLGTPNQLPKLRWHGCRELDTLNPVGFRRIFSSLENQRFLTSTKNCHLVEKSPNDLTSNVQRYQRSKKNRKNASLKIPKTPWIGWIMDR